MKVIGSFCIQVLIVFLFILSGAFVLGVMYGLNMKKIVEKEFKESGSF